MPATIPEMRIAPWGSLMAQMGQGEEAAVSVVIISAPDITVSGAGVAVSFDVEGSGASGVSTIGLLKQNGKTGGLLIHNAADVWDQDLGINLPELTPYLYLVDDQPQGAEFKIRGFVRADTYYFSTQFWIKSKSKPHLAAPLIDPGDIGSTTVTITGEVTYDGYGKWASVYPGTNDENYVGFETGTTWTERGIVIAAGRMPTVGDNDFIYQDALSGEREGAFNHAFSGLSEDTEYTVRIYGINSHGTGYSIPVTFKTGSGGGGGMLIRKKLFADIGLGLGLGIG